MAELTHAQLWQVCQRKPGDYEPYGKRKRLTPTRPALIGRLLRALPITPYSRSQSQRASACPEQDRRG